MSNKLSESSLTAIAMLRISGFEIDSESISILEKIDSGELSHEQAIQIIRKSCLKLSSQSQQSKQD